MEQFLHTIIKEAGDIGLSFFDKEFTIETKSDPKDLLTEADIAINSYLTGIIKETYPTHTILSEEEGLISGDGEYEWVIDPIDGTYNFAHGVGMWAVMIALLHKGNTVFSAVYFPVSKQLFYANSDGAFLNGKKISVAGKKVALKDAVSQTFVGKPFGPYGEEYDRYRAARLAYLSGTEPRDRHLGCSAGLVFLLVGYIDVAFGNCGMDWDYIPTFYILEQGGVVITDSHGHPWKRGRQDYILANSEGLHREIFSFFS